VTPPPRPTVHLVGPPSPDQLREVFPSAEYPPGTPVFRSHGHARGPWWFSCDGGGRFDLPAPHGTCYVAEDEVVTLLETWGGMKVVPDYLAQARDASELTVASAVTVADLTSNQAVAFRVTAEIFTTTDYAMTQSWAAALHDAGYDGVRYWARHDLRHVYACLALFDVAGDNGASAAHRYVVTDTTHLPRRRDLLERLRNETGIPVLPLP
jgi:hypothetical protein